MSATIARPQSDNRMDVKISISRRIRSVRPLVIGSCTDRDNYSLDLVKAHPLEGPQVNADLRAAVDGMRFD